jgi:hypothetical protein
MMEQKAETQVSRAATDVPHCACGEAGAACVSRAVQANGECDNAPTEAAASIWAGTHCLRTESRGLFLVSRTANGRIVCGGGDSYHVTVANDDVRISALSRAIAPAVYWLNLSATALLRGRQTYSLSIALVETQRRDAAHAYVGPTSDVSELPLARWLRSSMCAWAPVTSAFPIEVGEAESSARATSKREPWCGSLPADGMSMGYVTLRTEDTCNDGSACDGNATERLLHTSNEQRYRARTRKGFHHVLKVSNTVAPSIAHTPWACVASLICRMRASRRMLEPRVSRHMLRRSLRPCTQAAALLAERSRHPMAVRSRTASRLPAAPLQRDGRHALPPRAQIAQSGLGRRRRCPTWLRTAQRVAARVDAPSARHDRRAARRVLTTLALRR